MVWFKKNKSYTYSEVAKHNSENDPESSKLEFAPLTFFMYFVSEANSSLLDSGLFYQMLDKMQLIHSFHIMKWNYPEFASLTLHIVIKTDLITLIRDLFWYKCHSFYIHKVSIW